MDQAHKLKRPLRSLKVPFELKNRQMLAKKAVDNKICSSKPKVRNSREKVYSSDPTSVILIQDLSGFDDFISLILLMKSKKVKIELIVVNHGFSNVGSSINNVYDILAMFGDEETPVIAGSYFSPEEIAAGPNPGYDGANIPQQPVDPTTEPYEYPISSSSLVGQVAQHIYSSFIPPLFEEQGSTLYGTVNMLVRNKNACRRFVSNKATDFKPYIAPEDKIAEVLVNLSNNGKKVIIFNSGTFSDLGKYFRKYGDDHKEVIKEVVIMGGAFYNFTYKDFFCQDSSDVNCGLAESREQRWAGNIFTSDIYSLSPVYGSDEPLPGYDFENGDWDVKPPFRTMQEVNVFKDPTSAKIVFDSLYDYKIKTTVVPVDAVDPILVTDKLDELRCSPTPEGRFVYAIIQGLKDFNGPDYEYVVSLWDIFAAIVYLAPDVINESESGKVEVTQLGKIEDLQLVKCIDNSKNPFNVLQFNPYVGQTKLTNTDEDSTITVVTKLDADFAFSEVIARLNSSTNASCDQFNYYLGEIDTSKCDS
jgi:inosine-uridine nucleoside N-ribohydrolase